MSARLRLYGQNEKKEHSEAAGSKARTCKRPERLPSEVVFAKEAELASQALPYPLKSVSVFLQKFMRFRLLLEYDSDWLEVRAHSTNTFHSSMWNTAKRQRLFTVIFSLRATPALQKKWV